jgi:hypothetical protein
MVTPPLCQNDVLTERPCADDPQGATVGRATPPSVAVTGACITGEPALDD